jgi:hypothetical protein
MTAITWPPGLPQDVLREGYAERPAKTAIRTEMEAGPAKVRRRFSAGVRPLSIAVELTRAQAGTLLAFFADTLEGGALPFEWAHPRSGEAVRLRFVEEPEVTPLAPDTWRAALRLEILP